MLSALGDDGPVTGVESIALPSTLRHYEPAAEDSIHDRILRTMMVDTGRAMRLSAHESADNLLVGGDVDDGGLGRRSIYGFVTS